MTKKYITKRKTRYTDESVGKVKVIKDFLPSPKELVLKEETVKVTLSLTKASVDFFKDEAAQYNTQYQKMKTIVLLAWDPLFNSLFKFSDDFMNDKSQPVSARARPKT